MKESQVAMPEGLEWIPKTVERAGKECPSVPRLVCDQMNELLRGTLTQRPMSATVLGNIALQLIHSMESAPNVPKEVE